MPTFDQLVADYGSYVFGTGIIAALTSAVTLLVICLTERWLPLPGRLTDAIHRLFSASIGTALIGVALIAYNKACNPVELQANVSPTTYAHIRVWAEAQPAVAAAAKVAMRDGYVSVAEHRKLKAIYERETTASEDLAARAALEDNALFLAGARARPKAIEPARN